VIAVAAGGPRAAQLAGERGLGLFATEAKRELVQTWSKAGGKGPRYAEVGLCWDKSEANAKRIALERAAFSVLGWKVLTELPTPQGFDEATQHVREEDVAKGMPCGPDPERVVQAVKPYVDAGFDHIVLHQAGPNQEGFMGFWEKELKPRLAKL
jgi:G6PDH family F420-dependent oxidoreductase